MTSSSDPAIFPASDVYSEIEKVKLVEFRTAVSDILLTEEQRDDSFLIRWLRARTLDLGKAEDMLRKSMKWRQENEIDTLVDREEVPEDLRNATPIAYCGITKDGYAALIVPFGRHDVRAMLEKYGLAGCERFNYINIEKMTRILKEDGQKEGKNVTQIVEIMDWEGYSYRQMSSKLCRDFMLKMQGQLDSHYPELLRYAMIVNTPKVFAFLFAMLKPFVPKHTLEKIDICGPDTEAWKAIVREKFPIDRIPPHWGGTMKGVDEYCSGSPIWIQGPKDLRAYMHGLAEADADFHKIVVNARDKFVKKFDVIKEDSILEWKFKTERHDIGFQLTFTPFPAKQVNNNISNGALKSGVLVLITEDIVKNSRVDAQSAVQEGSQVCKLPGTYAFIFDNSFSIMKCKTLLYQIVVIDPEHQQHPENFEDCPEI